MFIYINTQYHNSNAISIEARDNNGKLVYTGGTPENQNRFEIGTIGLPIIISYISLFIIGILFYRMRSNHIVSRIFNILLNFEISKKKSFIIISCLVFIFIILNVTELWNPKEISRGDYYVVLHSVQQNTYTIDPSLILEPYLRIFLLKFSYLVLGNIRIIPFLESISLIILTYFFTTAITKKRFSGLIATAILIQSNLFVENSVSATEDNLWTLLYVLSLYLIIKKWYLSPVSFLLALISKALVILFLPMNVFFAFKSTISKNEKLMIYISYTLITITFLFTVFMHQTSVTSLGFDIEKFAEGFKVSSSWLRSDMIVSLFLLPLIVVLFIKSKKGITHADSIMFLIVGVVISAPLLLSITGITNQPYRFVPLIVFFAVGMGMLFSNDYIISNKKMNYVPILVFSVSFMIVLLSTISLIFPALIHTSTVS